jgi:PAS domain S-box-containing protein
MSTSPYTILIVEDFAADRELYRRSLLTDPNYTYRLLEAESLAQGRELSQCHQFDAVLLDYSLPDGDGLELLGELSARYPNPPPVVMLTGQGSESIAVRAIKLGAQDYLIKRDLTVELLQLTMRKAIENHRLRQQLQQVEDRFRISLDNMSDCVGLFCVMRDESRQIIDFRFDYLNPAALASNRMSSDDIGKSLCEIFPAFRTSSLFEEYCQLVTTGQPLIKEDLVYEDIFGGEKIVKYYAIHASLLNNDAFMVSWRDLTAQKQAESQLQAANQRIIEIWESMTDAYITVDRQWRVVYANQSATQIIYQLTNFAPIEFLGKSHWDLFPSLIGTDVEREFRRSLAEGVTVHLEVWFEPTQSWFEVHLYPSAEDLGIYFRDPTARKQLEVERIEAGQERDRFFNLSLDLLAIGSFNGYFVRLNPAFEQILGFTNAELMAQPFINFVHPDDRERTLAGAQSLADGNSVVSFENRYRCKDGTYRWMLWNAIPYAPSHVWYAIGHDITDRKQMEAALQASERKFSAIFEQSFELMGIVSLDGMLIEVNQTALDSIAARKEDILGQYFWDTPWWHTEQLQQQLQDSIARAAKGEFIRYEVQFPHPSGVMLTTDFSLKPVFDDVERVVTIVAEARDITDRKRAERDLQEAQERLQAGISVAGLGLARFDYATNLVALSPEAAIVYGFAPETSFVSRQQIHDTFHPDERAELEEIIAQVIDPAGTGWFARDHQVVWPNGEVRCLSVRKQVFFDRSGAVACPSYAILAAIDITDRKHAQRELAESEERLRTGIEVAGVGLAKFDYATNLVSLSPEAAALYGFAPDESVVTRERIHDTFHPDERAELEAIIAQVVDPLGTGWFAHDHRVVWPSGEVRYLSVRKQVFFDRVEAVGCPSHAILAAIDVTERKQTQSDLEARNQELDSFVHIVSHDLKAPLRAVANLSSWIEEDLEGSLTASTQEQMNLLRGRIERMSATIDGLLDYARIGRTEESIEPVAVADLIAETIETLAPPTTFTIAIAQNLPMLRTKRMLLSQVFTNLLGNAIKHHDRADGIIHLGIAERNEFYEFAIADDGPGIAPEQHERVFRIFQAVNPQKRTDSTGIGLAIVKKIVEAEGGTLRLESQLGKGTTFYFTWPK